MKKSIQVFLVSIITFTPSLAYSDQHCTPPGEREYYKEWLLTESQSLLHKCALGGLINFKILSVFDPRQTLLDFISGEACNFVRQKTQPFRDDLNGEIESWNNRIEALNTELDANTWVGRSDKYYGDSYNPYAVSNSERISGYSSDYFLYGNETVVTDSLTVEAQQNVLNNGAALSEDGSVTNLNAPYEVNRQVDDTTTDGLLDRGGTRNGALPRFPMPTPQDWDDVYKGIIE